LRKWAHATYTPVESRPHIGELGTKDDYLDQNSGLLNLIRMHAVHRDAPLLEERLAGFISTKQLTPSQLRRLPRELRARVKCEVLSA
jgi:hypothetical protein